MKNVIIYFILLVGIGTGCIKDDLDNLTVDNWDPEIAAPLVYSSLTVRDILDENEHELIVVDEDSREIALVYSDEVITISANELFQLPSFTLEHAVNIAGADLNQLVQNGSVTVREEEEADISPHTDMEIERLVLEDGQIDLEITSDIEVSGTLEIEMPDFTRNGQKFKRTYPVDHDGGQVVINETIDLSGYKVDLSSGGAGYNRFGIEYTFHADYEGQTVNATDFLNIRKTFSRLKFLRLYGNLGTRQLIDEGGKIDINVFKNNEGGYFELTNPSVAFFVTNSFGLPVDIEIEQFISENLHTGKETNILFSTFTNPFGINSPEMGEEGETAETVLEVNTDNSNIGKLIHPAPQVMNYEVKATANPNSQTSPENLPNFVTNQSSIELKTEVMLPLEGLAHSFILVDTAAFSLGEDFEQIDSLSFRLAVNNGFPLGTDVQIYFLDDNMRLKDSLFSEPAQIFAPAVTGTDGRVIESVRQTTDIGYGPARIEAVQNASYVVVKAQLETLEAHDGRIVKILDTYDIGVQLGMYISGNMQL